MQFVANNQQEQAVFGGLSGLLKTAAMENPHFSAQLILVDGQSSTKQLAEQLIADRSRAQDSVIRHQQGVRQVLSWQELPVRKKQPEIGFNDQGVYLITG